MTPPAPQHKLAGDCRSWPLLRSTAKRLKHWIRYESQNAVNTGHGDSERNDRWPVSREDRDVTACRVVQSIGGESDDYTDVGQRANCHTC